LAIFIALSGRYAVLLRLREQVFDRATPRVISLSVGRLGHREERQGIRVLKIDGEDTARAASKLHPVLLGSCRFSLIEEAVDLPLDAFGRHRTPSDTCVQR
jgi:hypothetical protein